METRQYGIVGQCAQFCRLAPFIGNAQQLMAGNGDNGPMTGMEVHLHLAVYHLKILQVSGFTAKAITPTVVAALGITAANPDNSYMLVACFAAVSALFVLPTYPTLLGAVQMDDTGTTRIGKWVFNHSFFIPGVLAIFFSVALGFVVCGFV